MDLTVDQPINSWSAMNMSHATAVAGGESDYMGLLFPMDLWTNRHLFLHINAYPGILRILSSLRLLFPTDLWTNHHLFLHINVYPGSAADFERPPTDLTVDSLMNFPVCQR